MYDDKEYTGPPCPVRTPEMKVGESVCASVIVRRMDATCGPSPSISSSYVEVAAEEILWNRTYHFRFPYDQDDLALEFMSKGEPVSLSGKVGYILECGDIYLETGAVLTDQEGPDEASSRV